MIQTILRGFRRVADVSGRDAPSQFWPYAAFVFVMTMAAFSAIFLPSFSESFERMQQFAVQHPDQAQVVSSPTSYSIQIKGAHPELFPDLGPIVHRMGAAILVAALLLGAAVSRRLHDRSMTGLRGLLPAPFLVFSSLQLPSVFARMARGDNTALGPFFAVFFSNALYMASLLWLIFLLGGRGDTAANRFGEPPAPIG